jgi:hypothetical protein
MKTCEKCKCKFSNWVVIDGKPKNLHSRKYCLTCSPWGKHNTKKIDRNTENLTHKFCPRCREFKLLNEFYNKGKPKTRKSVYCKPCTNKQTTERQKKLKQLCAEYKGGRCSSCGYNKYIGALEFHHVDPKQKDFNISHARSTAFGDKIKKELDKCVLLCSNCHKEEHFNMSL